MHYTGQVYRPPVEWATPPLEVTAGCSHNKCTFCTMYHKTPLAVSSLKNVENDLKEMQEDYGDGLKHIYLVNGDAFVLSTEKLLEIAALVKKYFPKMEAIGGYASINHIKRKSLDELKRLREAGYTGLHFGIETAYAPALNLLNKGFTVEETYENLRKVKQADMEYAANLMPGIAGRGNWKVNALETAKLLNELPPYMILVFCLSIAPDSDLAKIRDAGNFTEATEREMIEEIKLLLQSLNMRDDCYFFGSHPYDLIPVSGYFKDRDQMVAKLEEGMSKMEPEFLDSVYRRPPTP